MSGRLVDANLCYEGLVQACVSHCPTEALLFGEANSIAFRKQELMAERRVTREP